MNIGIVNISYNCAATIERALSVWKGVSGSNGLNVSVSCQHVCFGETYTLGYPIISPDGTIATLIRLEEGGIIDKLEIHQTFPVFEQTAWSNCIPFLAAQDLDYLVMVGSDEWWNPDEIKRVFEFIVNNPADYYKINFKNYINPNEYVDDFIVPRIWSMKRRGGVKRFWKDDLVVFNDGCFDYQTNFIQIPREIAFIEHWSWALPPLLLDKNTYRARNEAFVKRKLAFSATRYSICSWKWDDSKSKLVHNDEYYTSRNIPKPVIYEDIKTK